MADRKKICEVGGSGLFLPIFGDDEQRWPNSLRAILYFIALGWCFMGVALIADVFMGAIEKITSKKARKTIPETGRHVTVLVWNPTVANLTLMALGSSAPEILLSVIELLGNNFFSGDLGPSTIVGSAAFNLLCITAVCVSAIPAGELRKVKEMPVYIITATSSIGAYIWLLIILVGFSPNIVEIWEGVLTFLFFPILVFSAYLADKGYFSPHDAKAGSQHVVSAEMTKDEMALLASDVRQRHGKHLTDEQVEKIIETEHAPPTSRAKFRVAAIRDMTGGRRLALQKKLARGVSSHGMNSVVPFDGARPGKAPEEEDESQGVAFQFDSQKYAVLEGAGHVKLKVNRLGNLAIPASVGYKTRNGVAKAGSERNRNGIAKAGEDYAHAEGRLEFAPDVAQMSVTVTIIDDTANEDDEEFYVDLLTPQCVNGAILGDIPTSTVVIIDDDDPGTLEFVHSETLDVTDTVEVTDELEDKAVIIRVQRTQGSTGRVGCHYHTDDGTAKAGRDYKKVEGFLEFEPGQMSNDFKILIKATGLYERLMSFRVVLNEPTGGAKFNSQTDGGDQSTILNVVIKSKQENKARIDRMMSHMQSNWDKAKVGHNNWRDQFTEALLPSGDDGEPGVKDYIMHGVLLPWKLLFACVPPTDYADGWLCFFAALAMIGLVTAIIGDMAGLLGCVLTMPDEITAITLVALGTSLPDTFASKAAATSDPYADASIGNVTGSNSVNVFLGLGLPWLIGSFRWTVGGPNDEWRERYGNEKWAEDWQGGAFVVVSGGLTFSVMVFSCCAVVCICVLYIRRRRFGGELGGPSSNRTVTSAFFVSLWLLYVGLSSFYVLSQREEAAPAA